MRIATWNVNGLRARWDEVVAWADDERPEIFCLQEIKASAMQVPEPLTGLPAYWSLWHGAEGGYSGVSLHVRRDVHTAAPAFASPPFDIETRIATVDLGELLVASVYVPNGAKSYPDKVRFLEALAAWARELIAAGRELVICGDLNVALTDADLHPKQRKPGSLGQSPEERALLGAVLDAGLVDLLRRHHEGDDTVFTWWPPWRDEKKKNRGWRIDYILATPATAARATGCDVLRDYGTSDHAPVVADLDAASAAA